MAPATNAFDWAYSTGPTRLGLLDWAYSIGERATQSSVVCVGGVVAQATVPRDVGDLLVSLPITWRLANHDVSSQSHLTQSVSGTGPDAVA